MRRRLLAAAALLGGLLLGIAPAAASPDPEATLTGAVQLTSEQGHNCVRFASGQLRCWGTNYDGEMGVGGVADAQPAPTLVKDEAGTGVLADVVSVEAGFYTSCAVIEGGEARCWGFNGDGEIGDGTTDDPVLLPRVVRNTADTGPLTGVVRIAGGERHACALLEVGQVRCWGQNTYGELGTGATGPVQRLPQVVLNGAGTGPLTGVTQLDAGFRRTCARLISGQARCWGDDANGALGNGAPGSSALPVAVSNEAGTGPLTGVTQVTVGHGHTCARLGSGQARCWGRNDRGQIGNGTSGAGRVRPVVVRNPAGNGPLTGVMQIDVGNDGTCARVSGGQLRCWGRNDHGQIGNGTTGADRRLPKVVSNPAGSGPLVDVVQVQVGQLHACARLVGGELRCWGSNANGQIGDGTTGTDRPRPRRVVV